MFIRQLAKRIISNGQPRGKKAGRGRLADTDSCDLLAPWHFVVVLLVVVVACDQSQLWL